jgi:hypothetical protein
MSVYQTKEQIEQELINNLKNSGNFKKFVFTSLSKIYSIIRAIANSDYMFVSTKMVELQNATHPHTSHGPALSDWMEHYGLQEKDPIAARHNIRIGSSQPIEVDTTLSQGLIVHTGGTDTTKVKFKLIDTYTVPAGTIADARGFYTIPAVAECTLEGPVGNVAQDTITKIDSAPSGIDIVYNPDETPLVVGDYEESDASKHFRIKEVETGSNQMWTPDWYENEALAYPEVWRADYISSKELGIPGLSRLLITSKYTTTAQSVIDALYNDLNLTEDKNSGSGLVQVENLPRVDVDKIVYVRFSEASQIPDQASLDAVWENYFISLVRGQPFICDQLKSNYFQFFGVMAVVYSDAADVNVTADELATPAATFEVIGEVYV